MKNEFEELDRLKREKEGLEIELKKLKKKPEGKIGYVLLLIGFTLILFSIIYSNSISAFIGISLIFWGSLLSFIRPTKFVRKEILEASAIDQIRTIENIVDKLGFKGTPVYFSPRTMSGLRKVSLFIPKNDLPVISLDDLSLEGDTIINDEFIKMVSPGQTLSETMENELRTNFSILAIEDLGGSLRKIIDGLEIAANFNMELSDQEIKIEVKESIFYDIEEELGKTRAILIGDPLISAIACALTRSTGLAITIDNINLEPKTRSLTAVYKYQGLRVLSSEKYNSGS